jgi:putative flavoprotein involved in K+ transport
MEKMFDIIVIGGGQSGLTCGYYLRKLNFSYLILDKQSKGGGAWNNTWDSLTLFSPAEHSSLAGWLMPKSDNLFPSKQEVIDYLMNYEKHYNLLVQRDTEVISVHLVNEIFNIETSKGKLYAKVVINATGTWGNQFIPNTEGISDFKGLQLHSADYKNSIAFENKQVLVVGEGNSGAQIIAELSKVTEVSWATKNPPHFLPDDVDGFYLFNVATAKYCAEKNGEVFNAENYNLGNIVMIPAVKEAKERGVLQSKGMFKNISEEGVVWLDGSIEKFDVIIWCTGFGYATSYLIDLVKLDQRGKALTVESKSTEVEGLWFVGYGNWTGYASATLIGINRNVKQVVHEIESFLSR